MGENLRRISVLLKKSGKRHFLFFLILLGFSLFLIKFNQVDIAHLVQTEGRTFERAKVVKILEDNIQEDGTRVGQQKVLLKLLSGSQKGSLTEAISNNGYLFGAACRSGLKVIVIQSISGDIAIHTVYSPDRVNRICFHHLILYLFNSLAP